MYIGLAVELKSGLSKIIKEELVLMGDVRNLISQDNIVYPVRKVEGKMIGALKEGLLYKKSQLVLDEPMDLTKVETIRTLLDLGLISHEDENGEANLVNYLAQLKDFTPEAFFYLFEDSAKQGIVYQYDSKKSYCL